MTTSMLCSVSCLGYGNQVLTNDLCACLQRSASIRSSHDACGGSGTRSADCADDISEKHAVNRQTEGVMKELKAYALSLPAIAWHLIADQSYTDVCARRVPC